MKIIICILFLLSLINSQDLFDYISTYYIDTDITFEGRNGKLHFTRFADFIKMSRTVLSFNIYYQGVGKDGVIKRGFIKSEVYIFKTLGHHFSKL
jgi:hypothetical protein